VEITENKHAGNTEVKEEEETQSPLKKVGEIDIKWI
jgi:hypothetical protein